MHQFTCHPLAEKPDFVEEMADISMEEWGHLAPDWELDDWAADIREGLTPKGIEQTIVAADSKGAFAGMARLTSWDMDTRKDLYGWVASVYIKPQHRGLGLGTWLVAQVEAQAVGEGLAELHLYTPDAAEFYGRTGWEVLEHATYKGEQVIIMRKDLAAVMQMRENIQGDNVVPFKTN